MSKKNCICQRYLTIVILLTATAETVAFPFLIALMRPSSTASEGGIRNFEGDISSSRQPMLPINDEPIFIRDISSSPQNYLDEQSALLNNGGSLFFLHKRSQPVPTDDDFAFGLKRKRSQPVANDQLPVDDFSFGAKRKRSQPIHDQEISDFTFGAKKKRSQPLPESYDMDFYLRKRSQPATDASTEVSDFSFGAKKRSQPIPDTIPENDFSFGAKKRSSQPESIVN